jgi:hypothetical protein
LPEKPTGLSCGVCWHSNLDETFKTQGNCGLLLDTQSIAFLQNPEKDIFVSDIH